MALDSEQLPDPIAASATKTAALDFLSKIKTREKEFETGWWKKAKDASDIYNMDSKQKWEDETPYNILYSNTEVLLPSLYSATPKPDIRSRFRGQDVKPIPEMLERFLVIAADPASPGGDCFDNAMSDAVLSALVPGMGYVRIRYVKDRSFPLNYESGHYRTLIWGKASRWAKVPWIAFKHSMKKDQMMADFEIPELDQGNFEASSDIDEEKDDCFVYELWDKETKQVYFLSEEWGPKQLRVTDDPLGLENFFPTPGLLSLTQRPGLLKPIPLYVYYLNQAEELNRITVRLNKVISAIKVRGAYNALMGTDLAKLFSADVGDNELIAASESAMLAQSGGIDKNIWLVPIDRLIEVVRQLYSAREAVKQVIYELTGISDIIRGSSVASETATAQDLKNKWGTVRLRKMQTIVANYARDLFRMSVDCGSEKIPAQKWQEIVQLPIPTNAEKAIAQKQLAYTQQMPQIPGQPPAPPDPKLQATLQSPSMEDLLKKISSDMDRTFVVNIQTSSTIDLDTAQDRADVTEFMNAMGQLLPGLQGLTALPGGVDAAKAILVAVCQRYKFGIDIADIISQIQAPPPAPPAQTGPPPPSPQELQAQQMEIQMKMEKIQGEMQVNSAKRDLDLAKIEAEKQKLGHDIQLSGLRLVEQQAKLANMPKKAQNAPVPA